MKATATRDTLAEGTGVRGYIDIHFNTLVEMFGKPTRCIDGKIKADWVIKIEVNHEIEIVTIYDYKEEGPPEDKNIRWHIGGFDSNAVSMLKTYLEEEQATFQNCVVRVYSSDKGFQEILA
jgi:hypothetical protein